MAFTSNGSTSPVISGFSPAAGQSGDTITIRGKYFSGLTQSIQVTFGSVNSNVVRSNDSTIQCVVPNNVSGTAVALYLKVADTQIKAVNNFVLLVPAIESFSPFTGTFGDIVTIRGVNFSKEKIWNIVKFNGYPVAIISSSNSLLKVKVAPALVAKDNIITVEVNLQTATAKDNFMISPPVVSSISVNPEFIGATLHINGNNFNPTIINNSVLFVDKTAAILGATNNLLTVKIHAGIYKDRSFQIEVRVAEQSSFSELFTLKDAWIRKSDIPGAVNGAMAFSIGTKGYVGITGSFGNKLWQYDPATNVWTDVAPFPVNSQVIASFVIGDKAYAGSFQQFWRYDPQANIWERVADFPYSINARAVGLTANGKGYIITRNETQNFWEYDPVNNDWTMKEDLPGIISNNSWPDAGFVINNRLFIYESDNSLGPNPLMEYDFGNGTWLNKSSPVNDSGMTGFSVNGKGYLRGYSVLYRYDPQTDTWVTDLYGAPGNRTYAFVFVINEKAYFGAGMYNVHDLWEFDHNYE